MAGTSKFDDIHAQQIKAQARNGYIYEGVANNNKTVFGVDKSGNVISHNTPAYVTAVHDSTTANLYNITTEQVFEKQYYDGLPLLVKFDQAATGAISISVNGMAAKQCYYQSGDAFDDAEANIPYSLVYESSHDFFTI